MKRSKIHEFETDVPASELWEVYGTLRAAELLPELLPHILAKVELVSGDGGVGTILQLTFPPGIPGLPAAEMWEVYGGLLLGQLIPQLLPDILSRVELVDGDGGVGTVLLLTFPPVYLQLQVTFGLVIHVARNSWIRLESQKEKLFKIDNENYVKEATVVEGGFLNHGFQKYLVRFEIIGKTDKTSIIRSTIEYEVDDGHTDNASFVSTSGVATIAEAITKYIKEQKQADQAPKETSEEQSIQPE